MQKNIRNFCIIAHVDHGKSTLADRFLELTKTVPGREMREQFLDQMDIERERGITIKLQPVRMNYKGYELNLIDTPGHVDFTYEVSRSLIAVEGAILLVDATQGVQAQTVANLYLAIEQNLTIIPVINKIDLPNANIQKVSEEICHLLGCLKEDIILVSAKTGENVSQVLGVVIEKIPPPQVKENQPFRALIFDSIFDEYKGVIAYIRVKEGKVKKGDFVKFMASGKRLEVLEAGYFSPKLKAQEILRAGEIGYLITGLKEVSECRVGDTITDLSVIQPLGGYKEIKPMVFAGIFCKVGTDYLHLREAINKLKLNDASLNFSPENSPALGFGFRCGFLGLLHLEITQERLKREYGLDLVVTTPSVAYKLILKNDKEKIIKSAQEFPELSQIQQILEPVMKVDIFTPKKYLGVIMQLSAEKRGIYQNTEYLNPDVAILHYHFPLASIIVDFYDKLKSVSSGFASMNYDFLNYQLTELVKLDILVAEEKVEALSMLVYKDEVYKVARGVAQTLKETIPRQLFLVKIQAAIGGKIIASERISALRKDVTAKLYGGDYSRKRKLLEKQKKGKKKMAKIGRVDIPPEAFLRVLKR